MIRLGAIGVIVFAVGGLVLSSQLYDLLYMIHVSSPDLAFHLVTLIGFMLLGFGLWLIVQDSKPIQVQST